MSFSRQVAFDQKYNHPKKDNDTSSCVGSYLNSFVRAVLPDCYRSTSALTTQAELERPDK